MRSSRRNQGLNPEFIPEATPPNSEDSDFAQDFQIKTTVEEEERLRTEEEEENEANKEDVSSDKDERTTVTSNKDVDVDIVFSSDDSIANDSSEESMAVVEKDKVEKKSSKRSKLPDQLLYLINFIFLKFINDYPQA